MRRAAIVEHWPEMLRIAGSLKLGWVTAPLSPARHRRVLGKYRFDAVRELPSEIFRDYATAGSLGR